MIAFDTDVLTELLLGNASFVQRASTIPIAEQSLPVIVIDEEIMRGRLNTIRQSEAGRVSITISHAYALFEDSFRDFRRLQVLSYTSQAEALYQEWRGQGIRTATHDLRIAALCVTHSATLISRNRRDFENLPGLSVEFWM
ncbi:MAG: type II toxin-antitoxin system VapC family toxin [Deltaproteobacteria bacterium]|nr:type II toxin-antitoxin system VapC family toxin [Deltaproteobacteria bacterium]